MIRKFFELWPRSVLYWVIVLALTLLVVLLNFAKPQAPEIEGDLFLYIATAIAVSGYVFIRVGASHPVFRPAYRDWLLLTPYDGTQPLPMGPVLPEWRDAVFVALFAPLTALSTGVPACWIALVFLFAYLLACSEVFVLVSRPVEAWLTAMGLGISIAVILTPWFSIAILAVLLLALWRTIRHTYSVEALRSCASSSVATQRLSAGLLSELSAGVDRSKSLLVISAEGAEDLNRLSSRAQKYGWPLAVLGPLSYDSDAQSRTAIFAMSVLATTWALALGHHVREYVNIDGGLYFIPVVSGLLCLLALSRLAIYCLRFWPPQSWVSRILLGRIVIPGYDRVMVAPIAAAILAILGPYGFMAFGLNPLWSLALTIGVCTYVIFAGKPTMREWHLLGHYRLSKPHNIVRIQQ